MLYPNYSSENINRLKSSSSKDQSHQISDMQAGVQYDDDEQPTRELPCV
jgi:hypothetical protein